MKKNVILIIEDNEMNMKLFRSLLRFADFQILEAGDAEIGIQMAKTHLPDLILMDIQLPGIDGLQATRLIKEDSLLKNIPVVALTSHAMRGDDDKAKDAGCNGYITKPINTRTFVQEVSLFLKSTDEPPSAFEEQAMNNYKPKILVVDDEPINVKLVGAILAAEKFEILTAYNGKAAIEIIHKNKIDLVLLDVMMPEMSGYEVTRIIKENPQTKDIPVILITALQEMEDKMRGLEAGADEFLTKPVKKIEILARVKSMLRLRQFQEQITTRKISEDPISKSNMNLISVRNTAQRILLVEDDEKDSKLIQQLIDTEMYDFQVVKSGEEAIDIAMKEKIDLILLDIILPGLDGYQVCQFLKNNKKTRDTQIVMISCLSDLESKIKGVEEGVDDFLVKPIDKREINARINVLLKKKSYLDQLHTHHEKARSLAIIDGLTQLYNQAYFKRYLESEVIRSMNRGYLLGLIFADLDNFKKYNDALGHSFGDEILKKFTQIIKANIREIDFAARYGGEEFAVVFPYAEKDKVLDIAERIRKSIEENIFSEANSHPSLVNITASIGVAFCPTHAAKADDLIEKADYMLYCAKKAGKNRVLSWK